MNIVMHWPQWFFVGIYVFSICLNFRKGKEDGIIALASCVLGTWVLHCGGFW